MSWKSIECNSVADPAMRFVDDVGNSYQLTQAELVGNSEADTISDMEVKLGDTVDLTYEIGTGLPAVWSEDAAE